MSARNEYLDEIEELRDFHKRYDNYSHISWNRYDEIVISSQNLLDELKTMRDQMDRMRDEIGCILREVNGNKIEQSELNYAVNKYNRNYPKEES